MARVRGSTSQTHARASAQVRAELTLSRSKGSIESALLRTTRTLSSYPSRCSITRFSSSEMSILFASNMRRIMSHRGANHWMMASYE